MTSEGWQAGCKGRELIRLKHFFAGGFSTPGANIGKYLNRVVCRPFKDGASMIKRSRQHLTCAVVCIRAIVFYSL